MPCPLIARAKYIRLTQVDDCGQPTGFAVIDDCWPSFEVSPQIEDGDDINFSDARGVACATLPGCPTYQGDEITWTFHHASPEIFQVATNAPVRTDINGNPVGWDNCLVNCNAGFAAEIWMDIAGSTDACDDPDAEGQWMYVLWPWITAPRLGDWTIENDAVSFELVGRSRTGSRWGLGPWDVQMGAGGPGPLLDPVDPTCPGSIQFLTTVGPPTEPLCDLIPVPDESPSSP